MQATSEIVPEGEVNQITVLLAEDEVLLRLMISEHLRAAGFNVLEAANGEEARRIAGAVDRVDVVLSDVHMATPAEGLELARWLGEHHPGTPVILTSGSRTVSADGAWRTLANVTDFVPKPYVAEHVERLVRTRAGMRGASSR
jgi:DNA-binding NtrC family response regulator